MPIPSTRAELISQISSSFEKLQIELDTAGPSISGLNCVDDWTVKDLLAVRVWWTQSVIDWVQAGQRGEMPSLPAEGYRWSETPRLNQQVVQSAHPLSYQTVRRRLARGCERVMRTVEQLDDHELLGVGVYAWAGKYPLSRWISINTARQYVTARTFIRRAVRGSNGVSP